MRTQVVSWIIYYVIPEIVLHLCPIPTYTNELKCIGKNYYDVSIMIELVTKKRAIIAILFWVSLDPLSMYFLGTVQTPLDNVVFNPARSMCLIDFGNPKNKSVVCHRVIRSTDDRYASTFR